MINKNELTKIAKGILKSGGQVQNPQAMNPTRDWVIGLLIAIVIFGISSFWSVQMYGQYRVIVVEEGGQKGVDIPVYRASLVDDALTNFSNRKKVYGALVESSFIKAESEILIEEVELATSTPNLPPEEIELSLEKDITDTENVDALIDILSSQVERTDVE